MTAIACRKHGFDLRLLVIGNNEVAVTIRQSNARDFGLTGMFEHLDLVLRIAEENDLLEREKKSMLSNGHGSKKILSFTISQLKNIGFRIKNGDD